jgi:hypothetical protein
MEGRPQQAVVAMMDLLGMLATLVIALNVCVIIYCKIWP